MEKQKILKMSFSKVYPFYIEKAVKKGRTKEEVDQIIFWLTGYNNDLLKDQLVSNNDIETFFQEAPQINPNIYLIKGSICGHKVEGIEDEMIRKIRYLDKLIDELAKGKEMDKILRK